jgi:hypothetical protein
MANKRLWWFPATMIIIVSVVGSAPAPAQFARSFKSGNALYAQCTGDVTYDQGYCLGYAAGVADLRAAEVAAAESGTNVMKAIRICRPHDVTQGRAKDVVVDFFRRNPQMRNEQAAIQVELALWKAWPCN